MPEREPKKLVQAPLFPLPNVILPPGTLVPLHVFEPRYRQMLAWTIERERLIAMALYDLHRGPDPDGTPAVHEIVGLGKVVDCVALEDGRSDLVLRGVMRCRIVAEDRSQPFRVATLEPLVSHASDPTEAVALANMITARLGVQNPTPLVDANGCSDVADKVLQILRLDVLTRQTIFATLDVNGRLRALHRLIDGLADRQLPEQN